MTFRINAGAVSALVLSACLTLPAVGAQKQKAEEPAPTTPPIKVLLLPVDFDVLEMSASGIVEPVPDKTKEAELALTDSAGRVLRSTKRFQIIDLPAMSDEEKELLREHVTLYKATAVNAAQMMRLGGPAWKAKQKNFDYSIGDGLKFLIERSGADTAVVVAGAKVSSSGGRVAMMILLAAAGVAIPMGGAQATAGLIDLDTGKILWLDDSAAFGGDLGDKAKADQAMKTLVGGYPASRLLGVKTKAKKK
jgi:hypothetical protein